MSKLDTQTRFFNIIINKDSYSSDFEDQLTSFLNDVGKYAFIKHDKDYNKRVHYHVVLIREKRTRIISQLNSLCDYLKISNVGVQIEKCSNVDLSIQYLIHKNDDDKFKYDIDEIKSNLGGELETYLTYQDTGLNTQYVIKTIALCNYRLCDIIEAIGFDKYRYYRNVILDIYKSMKGQL